MSNGSATESVSTIVGNGKFDEPCNETFEDDVFDNMHEEPVKRVPFRIKFRFDEYGDDGKIICDENKTEVIEGWMNSIGPQHHEVHTGDRYVKFLLTKSYKYMDHIVIRKKILSI